MRGVVLMRIRRLCINLPPTAELCSTAHLAIIEHPSPPTAVSAQTYLGRPSTSLKLEESSVSAPIHESLVQRPDSCDACAAASCLRCLQHNLLTSPQVSNELGMGKG